MQPRWDLSLKTFEQLQTFKSTVYIIIKQCFLDNVFSLHNITTVVLARYLVDSVFLWMDRKRGWRHQRKLVINCNKQNLFQFLQTMGRCWKHCMKNKEGWNFQHLLRNILVFQFIREGRNRICPAHLSFVKNAVETSVVVCSGSQVGFVAEKRTPCWQNKSCALKREGNLLLALLCSLS